MADGNVSFSSDGSYRIGDAISQMDMKNTRKRTDVAGTQPKPPRTRKSKAASTSDAAAEAKVAPVQATPKAFDLNSLRKKATRGKKKVEPMEEVQATPEIPVENTTTAVEVAESSALTASQEVTPEPNEVATEVTVEPTTEPALAEAPAAVEEKPESTQSFRHLDASEERQMDTDDTKPGALSEMNLDRMSQTSEPEGPEESDDPEVVPVPTRSDDAEEDLQIAAPAEAEGITSESREEDAPTRYPEADPSPDAPAEDEQPPKVEPVMEEPGESIPAAVPPATEEKKSEQQGHFKVVPAGELLADGGTDEQIPQHLKSWIRKVIDAKVRYATAVFGSIARPELTAHYIYNDVARTGNIYVVVGCDERLTAVSYSFNAKSVRDASSVLSVQGGFAMLHDSIVAVYGQHNERTIAL